MRINKTQDENLLLQIKDMMQKDFTNAQIANELNIGTMTLYRIAKKHNLIKFEQPHKTVTKEQIDKCVELYNSGLTCIEISSIVNIGRLTISKHLKDKGIIIDVKRLTKEKQSKKNESKCFNLEGKLICKICDAKLKNNTRNICQSCYTNTRRLRLKLKAVNYKGGKCNNCKNIFKDIACYDFHHLDPSKKDFIISQNVTKKKWEIVEKELDKCVLLCANCHRMEHSNYTTNLKLLSYISEQQKSRPELLGSGFDEPNQS